MARDFIKVDRVTPSATHAGVLLNYINTLRTAYDLGRRCRDIMTRNNDGSNFADIESLFGVPATKGQAVFDLVNGSVGAMEGSFQVDDAKEIIDRVG